MDDGSLSKNNLSGILSTCSFDEQSHIRFIEKFKKMGIECNYREDGHGYLSIYFNKQGIYSLLSKIRKYLHNSLKYKFFNEKLEKASEEYYIRNCKNCNSLRFHLNYTKGKNYFCCICNGSNINHKINLEFYEWDNKFLNYGTVKITKIENIKNKSNNSHVYDIEVEDNHNFICSTPSGIGPIVHNCHHISSKTFSSIFYKIQTKYMLGLSATPERKDGLSKVIYWFLGPQIVNIKRESDNPTIKFVFNISHSEEKFNSLGKVNNPTMITDLTINPDRNKLLIALVPELIKQGRKILILSDRRFHCEYIKEQLTELKISSGVYLGGMKTASRNESVDCTVIIGTYQASGEGFDVPDLDTLILATPKSDVQQAVGRILRQKNENYPLVIDIVDEFSIFKGQYIKRKKYYKKNNFVVQ